MERVSALTSANLWNSLINQQTWGGVMVNVKAYGAKGDGVTDDTEAIQAAINAAANISTIIFMPSGVYKITSGLTTPTGFRGILGSDQNSTAIKVSGTGYTALIITNGIIYKHFKIFGTGNTANGLKFSGDGVDGGTFLAWLDVSHVRVESLNGFGVKIDTVWDSSFKGLTTELCGNASEYAFLGGFYFRRYHKHEYIRPNPSGTI